MIHGDRMDIPIFMATQHPDSALRYFSAREEVDEAIRDVLPRNAGGFGCDEKMIDYEGKLTPFLQPVWILKKIKELEVHRIVPGNDFLLTVRCSTFSKESPERHIISLLSAIMANVMSVKEFNTCVVKYIVHPMSLNVRELIGVQRRVLKLMEFAREELGLASDEQVSIIPLVEDSCVMVRIDELLESYVTMAKRTLGVYLDHIRVFLGKSDAALAYGHVTSAIAVKMALFKLWELADEMGMYIFPIIGSGTLPFRGHLSPSNIDCFTNTYKGYFTLTLQTSFRYDYTREEVLSAMNLIRIRRGRRPAEIECSRDALMKILRTFTSTYLETILKMSGIILKIADNIPARRERVEREVYGRELSQAVMFTRNKKLLDLYSVSKTIFPRAIRFTASLYTLGIPPTLIGLGRGLKSLTSSEREELFTIYPMLERDLKYDSKFTVLDVAKKYIPNFIMHDIMEDIEFLKSYFNLEFTCNEEYRNTLMAIYEEISKGKNASNHIVKAAVMRKGLG